MLLSFDQTSKLISSGKLLHIAGTENLLKKLPKGNWIGGSTEYFMTENGGKISGDMLFITELTYENYKICVYDEFSIPNVTLDAFDNGFSVVIMPSDSAVLKMYASKAPDFEGMFIKNIVGWVSGVNLSLPGQTPIVVNGQTGETMPDKAVVMHIGVPDGKLVSIAIVNIFTQNDDSPVFEFTSEGFSAETCLINGEKVALADFIKQSNLDIKLPLIGDYSGAGVNISFKEVENGVVHFYAPVFPGIKYRTAKPILNYAEEFNSKLKNILDVESAFSCNCILNFLYGELEGKDINAFFGPITFGEIAFQLMNQTLVYVTLL